MFSSYQEDALPLGNLGYEPQLFAVSDYIITQLLSEYQ